MKITILKRLVVILMAVVILASAAVGVSAAYVTMLDYGLGYYSRVNALRWLNGTGSTATNATKFFVYWALDSFDSDYTYTFTFNFSSDADLNYSSKYITGSTEGYVFLESFLIGNYYDFSKASDLDVYSSFDKVDDKYVLTVKLNPGLLNWVKFPMYVYLYYDLKSETTFTTNGWGVSAEYDPGGSKLTDEILSDIRDQLHHGDGYPTPDGSALTEQGAAMSSAEGAVRDKSTSLASSVSTEWTQYQTSAKNAAVTLKPAAAAVNNIYTLVIDAMPDEVIALFIAIAVLLFIGWLIGRVRE